mmetsp:Transcript_20108/g.53093  ORF Transcript_20108/g.53093 Transcript_20108/m.53093 type:complete len:90 (-) Transcript_20108:21-290(-)
MGWNLPAYRAAEQAQAAMVGASSRATSSGPPGEGSPLGVYGNTFQYEGLLTDQEGAMHTAMGTAMLAPMDSRSGSQSPSSHSPPASWFG